MAKKKLNRVWALDKYAGCRLVSETESVEQAVRTLRRQYPGKTILIHSPTGRLVAERKP